MKLVRSLFTVSLMACLGFGAFALLAPPSAIAGKGGKGGGGGPPSPPIDCPCAETIELAPGLVCVLDDCAELAPDAYECLYVCPLPF